MPDEPSKKKTAEQVATTPQAGLGGRVARLVHWAADSKLRMALVGSLFIAIFGSVFATWSYLAHLAVSQDERYTLARALVALDEKDFDKAKHIVGEMQRQGAESQEFGGALFVLGAVKAAQADLEWSKDRQRAMHLVAARYLEKARELGVPERLKTQALFMVGQSLVKGNQPQAGIEVLQTALADKNLPTTEIHALLAAAYQSTAEPDLAAALLHNQAVLDDTSISPQRRNTASITQADILVQLGRLEEAGKYLKFLGSNEEQQARLKNISGRLAIAKAQQLPIGSEPRTALAKQARADLNEAQRLDPLSGDITRQSMYWRGKSYEITGEQAAAIQQYDQLSKAYGDTAESQAATLAKADLARQAGNREQALAGYRSTLEMVGDPVTYVNHLLPFSALQEKLSRAVNDFLEKEQFETAMALVDTLQPVFSLTEVTELRAQTHEKWALAKFAEADQATHRETEKYLREGRYHHRAAGSAHELLSELRYASRNFTLDLWQAADNYYQGQSYTHVERMLVKFLHHEAQEKQAIALLRLGQSQLALGKNAAAIETLEECIEMHPGDALIYQARLECAHANLQLDHGKRAEELLLTNLVGGSLEPTASEWRDSLFMLGDYLHNSNQYQAAIEKLDEAVRRYPDAPQALLARYTIARSYHSASEKPARQAREAKTESERLKNRKERDKNLLSALDNYLQVQRMLTLQGHVDSNDLERTLLRNCYMMQGSVLFQLKRYEEARKAYANISTFYQNEPFVLESFVHIANCYRRLNKPVKAKGTIEQAKLVLGRMPKETDFKLVTNFSRQSWELLLNEMSTW
ncbi:MAG: tetratricopeptide repeat protein [Planctomycetes bacterium]|nr:tetratricopeptide repeat protein [Planctomycetota bacterium]